MDDKENVPPEAHPCAVCGEMRPLTQFPLLNRRAQLRAPDCRACRRRRQNEARVQLERGGKKCLRCGQWRELDHFAPGRGLGGCLPRCRECQGPRARQTLRFSAQEGRKECGRCRRFLPLDRFSRKAASAPAGPRCGDFAA